MVIIIFVRKVERSNSLDVRLMEGDEAAVESYTCGGEVEVVKQHRHVVVKSSVSCKCVLITRNKKDTKSRSTL